MEMPMIFANELLTNMTPFGGLFYLLGFPDIIFIFAWVRLHEFLHTYAASVLLNLPFLECHPFLGACPLWFGGCIPLAFFHMGNASGQQWNIDRHLDLLLLLNHQQKDSQRTSLYQINVNKNGWQQRLLGGLLGCFLQIRHHADTMQNWLLHSQHLNSIGFVLFLCFATHFPFWFLECLGCSFCCCVLIPLCILLLDGGRVVVLKFWIQVFASHFIT